MRVISWLISAQNTEKRWNIYRLKVIWLQIFSLTNLLRVMLKWDHFLFRKKKYERIQTLGSNKVVCTQIDKCLSGTLVRIDAFGTIIISISMRKCMQCNGFCFVFFCRWRCVVDSVIFGMLYANFTLCCPVCQRFIPIDRVASS